MGLNLSILTEKLAKEIVEETSIRLQRNVNIMDTNGIIIASFNKQRIGSIHQGAIEVITTGKSLVIEEQSNDVWEGAQSGVNLPIVFMEKIIGVIGVTGNPDNIKDIGELVKMTTELMVKQEFIDSQQEWKQRTKEMLVDQLLKTNSSVSAIERNLGLLDINFSPPYTSVIIQILNSEIPNRLLIERLEKTEGLHNGVISFININRLFIALNGIAEQSIKNKIQEIYVLLKKMGITFRLAYSLTFDNIKRFNHSYNECEIALQLSEDTEVLISFEQIEIMSLILQNETSITNHFMKRILKNIDETKIKTLKAFFKNNLIIQKTSDELYIHRNTLIYRLNKVIEYTGYNPREFKDALILQVALWIHQKGDNE